MNLECYEYDRLDEFSYRFYSEGPRGTFKLHIRFTRIRDLTYNLGFGVVDNESEWIDDLFEVRNGDSQKILSTVASAALDFLNAHPDNSIFATGSTSSRTRLYQMGISKVLPSLTGYVIAGCVMNKRQPENTGQVFTRLPVEWCAFEAGVAYDAFLICKSQVLN